MVNEAYWNSATVNAHVALVGRMLFMISLGFFFYDLILSFPFDWSIISGKRQRRLPQLAYFGTKFLLICFFIVNFVVNFAYHEINCTVALEMVEMVMGFTVVTSSILLACRTVCVYEGPTQKFVTFTLTILTCGLLAAWMADVDSVTIYWAPGQGDPWTDGACVQERISNSYWVKYVCTIIFDGIVLFLTIFGLLQMSGPSHIGAVLLRQGIIYFLITFIANLLITILTLLKLSPVMSLVIAIPQTTICVIAACRLYINLADEARSAHEASQQSYADRLRYSGGGGGLAGGIESARPITTSNKQSSTQSSNSRSKQQSNSRKSRLTNYLFRKDGGVQETAVPSYFSSSSDPTNPNGAVTRTRNGGTTAIPQHPLIREKENENSQGSSQETHNQHPQQQKLPVVPSVQTMQNRLNLQNHQNSYLASTSNHPSDEDLEKQASRSNLSVNQTERFYDPPQTPSGIAIHQQQQGDDELPTTRGGGGSYFTQPNNTQQQQPQLTARIPPRNSSGVHHHHHQGQRLRTLPVSSVHQDDGVQVETVNYVVVEDAPAYTPPLSQSNHQTRYASPRPYNPYDVNSSNRRNGNGRSQQQPPQDDDEVVIHQAQQPRFTAVRREPSHA